MALPELLAPRSSQAPVATSVNRNTAKFLRCPSREARPQRTKLKSFGDTNPAP